MNQGEGRGGGREREDRGRRTNKGEREKLSGASSRRSALDNLQRQQNRAGICGQTKLRDQPESKHQVYKPNSIVSFKVNLVQHDA